LLRVAAGAAAGVMAVATLATAGPAAAQTAPQTTAAGWPQLQGGAAHSGNSPYERSVTGKNAGGLALAWQDKVAGGSGQGEVVVTGGTVYLAANTDVTAYSAATGAQIWQQTGLPALAVGTPAVQGGFVVLETSTKTGIGHYRTELVALNSSTGAIAWTRAVSGLIANTAVTVTSTRVYASVGDDQIESLGLATGDVAWKSATLPGAGYCSISTPSVSGDQVVVSVGGVDEDAVSTATGDLTWHTSLSTDTEGCILDPMPAISSGVVYSSSLSGITAVDLASGAVLWQNADVVQNTGPVSVTSGEVIARAAGTRALTALSLSSGTVLWQTTTKYDISAVAVFGTLAWALENRSGNEGLVPVAFTLGDGQRAYAGTYLDNGSADWPPVVDAGHVYINTGYDLDCLALP
jgi:outer membrane protein assembly factor BamB